MAHGFCAYAYPRAFSLLLLLVLMLVCFCPCYRVLVLMFVGTSLRTTVLVMWSINEIIMLVLVLMLMSWWKPDLRLVLTSAGANHERKADAVSGCLVASFVRTFSQQKALCFFPSFVPLWTTPSVPPAGSWCVSAESSLIRRLVCYTWRSLVFPKHSPHYANVRFRLYARSLQINLGCLIG